MSGNDEPKPMDLNALRRDILSESEEVHAIIEQTEQDIIVDDFQEDRERCMVHEAGRDTAANRP